MNYKYFVGQSVEINNFAGSGPYINDSMRAKLGRNSTVCTLPDSTKNLQLEDGFFYAAHWLRPAFTLGEKVRVTSLESSIIPTGQHNPGRVSGMRVGKVLIIQKRNDTGNYVADDGYIYAPEWLTPLEFANQAPPERVEIDLDFLFGADVNRMVRGSAEYAKLYASVMATYDPVDQTVSREAVVKAMAEVCGDWQLKIKEACGMVDVLKERGTIVLTSEAKIREVTEGLSALLGKKVEVLKGETVAGLPELSGTDGNAKAYLIYGIKPDELEVTIHSGRSTGQAVIEFRKKA